MSVLPRLKPGLRQQKLDNQILVYDPQGERVHLLDPTTGFVLEQLDDRSWTRDRAIRDISAKTGLKDGEAALSLAIDEIAKAGLFATESGPVAPLVDMRRREMLRKLAVGGAAAFLVPAIATLTATSAYGQTTLAGNCAPCNKDNDCQSNSCGKDNQCYTPNAPGCGVQNAPCTIAASCLCCKGDCTGPGGAGGCA